MTDQGHLPDGQDPSVIMQLATAYWGSQTLLTANRIGLFGALKGKVMTPAEAASALGTAERPTRLLLQACAALGLLDPAGEGFRNAAVAERFLVPGGSTYLGDALRYSDDLYETWGRLEASLRGDAPVMAEETYLGRDPAQTRHFVRGMHNRALAVGQALAGMVDLSGRKRMLDLGGGPGTYSALFALRNPGLHCTVLDLPDVVEIAREIIAEMGVMDRVDLVAGDYAETGFPEDNDAVLISGVLHRESPRGSRDLIGRAARTLVRGGMLIVSDVLTDHTGVMPPFAPLFGLNMLLTAPNGGVHRDTDVESWMIEAGLDEVEIRPFPPPLPHRVLIGILREKPSSGARLR